MRLLTRQPRLRQFVLSIYRRLKYTLALLCTSALQGRKTNVAQSNESQLPLSSGTQFKKTELVEDGWTFAAVDQSSKYVGTEGRRGWYAVGSNPRRPVWNPRIKLTTLGAVTHDGESLHLSTEEYLTAEYGIALLEALVEEFGEKLIVFLDRAPYFYAKDLWEFVGDERSVEYIDDTVVACVRGEKLQVWYFPPRLPELNPIEQCWNQFKEWYRCRFIEDLPTLKQSLTSAFGSINEPDILAHTDSLNW